MAKNITLMGADYQQVPAVQLPQTGGGTATFYDINVIDNLDSDSSTDALSAKQGKVLKQSIDTNAGVDDKSSLVTNAITDMTAIANKNNRVVEIRGYSRTAISVSDNTKLFNMGNEIRPITERPCPIFDYSTGKPINGCVWVSGDGKATYYGDAITSKQIIFTLTFISKE